MFLLNEAFQEGAILSQETEYGYHRREHTHRGMYTPEVHQDCLEDQ